MNTRAGNRAENPPVVRCILWHARGSTLPSALLAALDRPTIQWKAWDCDLLTLAEVLRPGVSPDQLTHHAKARVIVLVDPTRLHGLGHVLATLARYRPETPVWVFEGGASPRLRGMTIDAVHAAFVEPDGHVAREMEATRAGQSAGGTIDARPVHVVTRPMGVIVPKPVATQTMTPSRPSTPSLRLVDHAADDAKGSEREGGVLLPSNPTHDSADDSHAPDAAASPGSTLLSADEIEMLLSEDPPRAAKNVDGSGRGEPPSRGGNVR